MTDAGWQVPLYLAAALLGAVELIRGRGGADGGAYLATREAHAVHVAMNLAMAAMASSLWTGAGRTATLVALAATAVPLALRLRGGGAGTVYHLLGAVVMLYAAWTMPVMAGMAGMEMPPPRGWAPFLLGWLFLIDGAVTALFAFVVPRALLRMEASLGRRAGAPATGIADLRLSAIPHVVMDLGMALMLL